MADSPFSPASRTNSTHDKSSSSVRTRALFDTRHSKQGDGRDMEEETTENPHGNDLEDSKSDVDHQRTRLEHIVQSQETVARLRLQVQERRTALRTIRLKVSECDRRFMDELYYLRSSGRVGDCSRLMELYDECEEARRVVGPAEDDYEPLELQLGEIEFANTKPIQHAISILQNDGLKRALDGLEESSVESHISFESTATSGSHPEQEYGTNATSVFAEVQEAACNLLTSQNAETPTAPDTIPAETRRQRPTVLPTPGHKLRQLQPIYGIRSAEDDLFENWNPTSSDCDVDLVFERDLLDGIYNESGASWPYKKESALFSFDPKSNPQLSSFLFFNKEQDSYSILNDYLIDFRSTRDRINRWLLHCLRTSYREAMRLKQAVLRTGNMNDQWPAQALDLWDKDDAAVLHFDAASTEPTTEQDAPANSQTVFIPGNIRLELRNRGFSGITTEMEGDRNTHLSPAVSRSTDRPLFLWTSLLQYDEPQEPG
ncbi:MAG: hypothetical protein M1822_007008 [Bathelium mastoideum]|nr:MAG: hypothetical protein M1822_007008 [Bathelium mastoideum]